MYYVIKANLDAKEAFRKGEVSLFNDLIEAKNFADSLKADTGWGYSVVKIEWVWGTKALADLKKEGAI